MGSSVGVNRLGGSVRQVGGGAEWGSEEKWGKWVKWELVKWLGKCKEGSAGARQSFLVIYQLNSCSITGGVRTEDYREYQNSHICTYRPIMTDG